MALVKCPDCGKMVSERALTCPDCGCPREFFEIGAVEKEIVEKENIERIIFRVAGHQVNVPGDGYENYAKMFGDFVNLSIASVDLVAHLYEESKSIEKALEKVPVKAGELLNAAIEVAMKMLYSLDIHMTPEEFLDKYYYSHQIDYEKHYNTIVEGYASIMDYKQQLSNYRQVQIASRGRWTGGGFGVKGAIKGAVSASLMNAGSDFLHSFGDNARKRSDNEKINKMLNDFYNLPDTKRLLCDSLGDCMLQIYLALTDEMKQHGFIAKADFGFEPQKAYTLYEQTIKYESNSEKWLTNIIQCIMLWPAEKKFYNSIIGEIYANLNDGPEESNFYAFLRYWGITTLFDEKHLERKQTKEEKEFVERIKSVVEGTSLLENEKACFKFVPFKELSVEEQKELIEMVREPFIGNYIIYYSDEYLLTDVLLSDFFDDAIMIVDIKKIIYQQTDVKVENGEIVEEGEMNFTMKDSPGMVWYDGGSCNTRNIVALINYGISAEGAEKEWKTRLLNYDFGRGFKSNNFSVEIRTEDDYIKGMEYMASACAKSGIVLRENAEASKFLSSIQKWKVSGKSKWSQRI